jgi:lysozyme family protein
VSANFDLCFERLMGSEGGYTFHPDDPGGETQWGISKRSYPLLNIHALTRDDAREIYRRDFWDRGRFEQFGQALAYQVFDIAVNSGIETAIRMLQRAVGAADDGHIGPVTINLVKTRSISDVVMLLVAERLEFWRKLSTWKTFGKGWAGRCVQILKYGAEDA